MRKFKLKVVDLATGKKNSGRHLVDAETNILQICPHTSEYDPCGNWCPKFAIEDCVEFKSDKETLVEKTLPKMFCGGDICGEVVK